MMTISIESIYRKRLEEEGLSRWWDFLERKGQVHEYREIHLYHGSYLHTVCKICGKETSRAQMGSHFRQVLVKWDEHQRWVKAYQEACEEVLIKVLHEHGLEVHWGTWCGESIAFVAKTGSIPRRLLRKVSA